MLIVPCVSTVTFIPLSLKAAAEILENMVFHGDNSFDLKCVTLGFIYVFK